MAQRGRRSAPLNPDLDPHAQRFVAELRAYVLAVCRAHVSECVAPPVHEHLRVLSRAAIVGNFPRLTPADWRNAFAHEARNRLAKCREGKVGRTALYAADRVGAWLVNRGTYSIAEARAILRGEFLEPEPAERPAVRLVKGRNGKDTE